MTPVERVELVEMRDEFRETLADISASQRESFREMREDMARGFRDLSRKEDDTRERVARMEGGIGMVRWLGPGGVAAIIIGLLIQAGVLR